MINPGEVGSGAVVAVMVSEAIEIIKKSPRFGWLTCDSETLNRVVGGVAAFLSGLGLQFHFDAETGRLVIEGLLTSSMIHGAAQWAAQQAYYRVAMRPEPHCTHKEPL